MDPQNLPISREDRLGLAHGPLWNFKALRSGILSEVVDKTYQEVLASPQGSSLELLLGEALYQERIRLKRNRPNLFTKERHRGDQVLWSKVQSGLLSPPAVSDRKGLVRDILSHYLQEIGGNFNPRVYNFATSAVPLGMSWLLNATGSRTLLPKHMTESVNSKLKIEGEVPMLRNLSKRGTILLVPTHQSNIDSILIGYVIHLMGLPPFAYGAGLNLFSNPVLKYFMSRLGAYTVDRQKSNPIYKTALKNYSTRILREGIHSIFFPGGGRCRSGAIESKLKLGLLGTGLEAQILNLKAKRPNPNVYVVPMVTSYHFVLEASSLIEDYLMEAGKHRFIIMDDESWQAQKIANFFWKVFSAESSSIVRIGKPMDVFGNFVDEEGRSIGPNGTTIDPVKWLTTRGELRAEPERDREYVRELGAKIGDRFHRENTVLSSHFVAFSFFETLRKVYPDLDLYRFLRLSLAQRSVPLESFLQEAEYFHGKLIEFAEKGKLYLSAELKTADVRALVMDGVKNLGLFHENAVVRVGEGAIWTEDMNLLYYYRNRLSGYGLQRIHDRKGFLA